MADMSKFSKSEFPAQARERLQWCLDAVRANQEVVAVILRGIDSSDSATLILALHAFRGFENSDRDALTINGGIFSKEQIEVLRERL